MKIRLPSPSDMMVDASKYRYDSEGNNIKYYREFERKLPKEVRKKKAQLELQALLLHQENISLDPTIDDYQKKEAYKIIAERYRRLSWCLL